MLIGLQERRGTDHPLDIVESVADAEDFAYERTEDGEVRLEAPGAWRDHPIWFAWNDMAEILHVCLGLDAKAPDNRRAEVCDLLVLLNERMWLGHFDMWSEDGTVIYRHALPLPDGAQPTPGQIALMIEAAVEAGERFYPAFNFLVWAGKPPAEAVAAALFETAGEA